MIGNRKLLLTLIAAALALMHILWEFFTGGVVTHYPLADDSNPGLSNWWGLITIPVLTWIMLSLVERRNSKDGASNKEQPKVNPQYFLGGLAFGLLMALLWEAGQEDILQYLILAPWLMAFFVKTYLPETTIGFVLVMVYTFGGVLPIAFSLVIQTGGFFIYLVFNRGARWLVAKAKERR
jgi:hypothetical protein